jgi:hypothetical protein
MGYILYAGPYTPQLNGPTSSPSQNFTVKIPSGTRGPAQLAVARFYLSSVSCDRTSKTKLTKPGP